MYTLRNRDACELAERVREMSVISKVTYLVVESFVVRREATCSKLRRWSKNSNRRFNGVLGMAKSPLGQKLKIEKMQCIQQREMNVSKVSKGIGIKTRILQGFNTHTPFQTKRISRTPRSGPLQSQSTKSQVSTESPEIEVYDLQSSRILVETSMLAAVTALSQFLLGLLRLEMYMYYILPFPLVLASVRSDPAAGRKTLMATFFLMLVAYVTLFGFVGITLGHLWHRQRHWIVTIPLCVVATILSLFAFILLGSFILKENVFKLVVYNVYTIFVKLTTACGLQVNASSLAITIALLGLMAIRSIQFGGFYITPSLGVFYIIILQFCYAIVLTNMGYKIGRIPGVLQRFVKQEDSKLFLDKIAQHGDSNACFCPFCYASDARKRDNHLIDKSLDITVSRRQK